MSSANRDGRSPDVGGPEASHEPRMVLIVDDMRDAARMLGKLVEKLGHHARVVQDSTLALDVARDSRPDVVISDLSMPGVDGFELARLLRKEPGLETALLVAVSGYDRESDRAAAVEAGFDLVLKKPIGIDALRGLFEKTR